MPFHISNAAHIKHFSNISMGFRKNRQTAISIRKLNIFSRFIIHGFELLPSSAVIIIINNTENRARKPNFIFHLYFILTRLCLRICVPANPPSMHYANGKYEIFFSSFL